MYNLIMREVMPDGWQQRPNWAPLSWDLESEQIIREIS